MIAIPVGTEGDYHLYPESRVELIIVLKHMITLYIGGMQLYVTDNTKEKITYETNVTFLSKEDFVHFKASILEGAIGFNPLLCSERRDRPDKARIPGTIMDTYRDYGRGTGTIDPSSKPFDKPC